MTIKPHEDKDEKRRHILEAARRLLVARGYQDVALDDVAKAAGVAKGTLFLYYKSKDDLVTSAFADLVDQLGASLDAVAASGKTGRALLQDGARTILEHFDRNRDFMSLGRLPGCKERSAGRLLEKFCRNHERLAELLKRAAKDLPLAGEARFLSAAFLGLCRTTMIYESLTGRVDAREQRVERVVEFFLKGAAKR